MPNEDTPKQKEPENLANKAGIMVVSRAITIVVQLSSMVILTRILRKETFGLLTFVLIAYATVLTISQLGLPDSIFYFFERVPKTSRKSLALLMGKTLFLIGLGSSLILLILTFIAPRWGYSVNGLFIPLIFLALLELPTIPLPNIMIAIERAKTAAWLNIVFGITQFLALVIPASLGQPLMVIMISLLGYGAVRFVLSNLVFFKSFKGKRGPLAKGMMKELLRYSVPLGFSQILWGLNRQIDKFIVAAFFPAAILAEYAIGAWELPVIPTIAYSVAAVMMPKFVSFHLKGDHAELLSLWLKAIKKVSIIVLPLTILFLIIAEEFIVVLFSEKYIAAALPFRIYTLILIQRVAAYSSMHRALGNTKIISYAAIYLVAINLGLSIPLVLLMGIAGPPTATLIANMFTWWYSLKKMASTLGVSLSEVFPFGFYGKTMLTSVVASVPALLFKASVTASIHIKLIALIILYLLAYAVFSNLFGVVKREDWAYLGRGLRLKSS